MAQRISRAKQTHQGLAGAVPMPAEAERDRAPALGAARPLPDLQRGLRQQRRRRAGAGRAGGGSDPPRPRSPTRRCPTIPRSRGLLALMLLTDARRPARTDAGGELIPLAEQDRALLGPGRRSPRASPCSPGGRRAAPSASTSCRRRSPPCTTRPPAPRTPTGARSSPSTACSSGSPATRWSRSTARSRAAMVDGPRAGLALLDALDEPAEGHHRLARRPRPPAGAWPATPGPRSPSTSGRRAAPAASPSSAT